MVVVAWGGGGKGAWGALSRTCSRTRWRGGGCRASGLGL